MVECPICSRPVKESNINTHIDSGCTTHVESEVSTPVSSFFKTPGPKKEINSIASQPTSSPGPSRVPTSKRPLDDNQQDAAPASPSNLEPPTKKSKPNALQKAAPLAERMRPTTLDEVHGQELVGVNGVLRGLIEQDRVPSMILWGSAGTGKTTIARVIANMVGSRFIEINSTTSGVAECKKIFAEAKAELGLTGRKTIIFCDEIHRFSKSQQDVFLGPVEAGHVTLIGATTENPSFKVQNALLSRCRTFTLAKLTDQDILAILHRALNESSSTYNPNSSLVNDDLLTYLATFSDGDARTSLNLLELAMDLSTRPGMTITQLKSSLTKTLVYDRSGDQHYDTISAFHKSIRGSDPDAALYYLARMIQSGEDALYIARRMIVIASEDVGLADNSMLSLTTATYAAAEKIGLPEARINLAHCAVALCLAPKSIRAYRGLANATAALSEPGVAGIPIPIHLRNAPTRLMKELGYGKEYKYNPMYQDGRVKQEYLPEKLIGRKFLQDRHLGLERDPELQYDDNDAIIAVNGHAADNASAKNKASSFQQTHQSHPQSQTQPLPTSHPHKPTFHTCKYRRLSPPTSSTSQLDLDLDVKGQREAEGEQSCRTSHHIDGTPLDPNTIDDANDANDDNNGRTTLSPQPPKASDEDDAAYEQGDYPHTADAARGTGERVNGDGDTGPDLTTTTTTSRGGVEGGGDEGDGETDEGEGDGEGDGDGDAEYLIEYE